MCKVLYLVLSLGLLSLSTTATAEEPMGAAQGSFLLRFFSPIPKPTMELIMMDSMEKSTDVSRPITKNEWRPVVSIPALKLVKSTRENAQLDAFILTQVGGGISYQSLEYEPKTGKWECKRSISPLTVLLSANTANDKSVEISYAITFGFFNNVIMTGVGWDFGDVGGDRSRLFGLLSIGININN